MTTGQRLIADNFDRIDAAGTTGTQPFMERVKARDELAGEIDAAIRDAVKAENDRCTTTLTKMADEHAAGPCSSYDDVSVQEAHGWVEQALRDAVEMLRVEERGRAAAVPTWTTTPPSSPGFYWLREPDDAHPAARVVEVRRYPSDSHLNGRLYVSTGDGVPRLIGPAFPPSRTPNIDPDAEWAGPITPPPPPAAT